MHEEKRDRVIVTVIPCVCERGRVRVREEECVCARMREKNQPRF